MLGLSLGASAVYSVLSIINRVTRDVALSQQTATLNTSLSDRPVFDLIYQVLAIVVDLVPVALVAFLLWREQRPHLARLGVDAFTGVRIGKRFELTVEGEVGEDVLAQARRIADDILSNSVIEDVVNIEVVE